MTGTLTTTPGALFRPQVLIVNENVRVLEVKIDGKVQPDFEQYKRPWDGSYNVDRLFETCKAGSVIEIYVLFLKRVKVAASLFGFAQVSQ